MKHLQRLDQTSLFLFKSLKSSSRQSLLPNPTLLPVDITVPGSMYLLVCVAVLASASILLYHVYLLALPKPIPHIPHNEAAVNRLFGDLPSVMSAKYRRHWIYDQPASHGSPIAQIMVYPFRRPLVIVSDYRETIDILSRRSKEFDRGTKTADCVGITAPNFHFVFESRDPRFRRQRELLRDLMSPSFLEQVAAPRIYEAATGLVDLWSTKEHRARGRPFVADHDFYMATLDIICTVAFGIEDGKSSLRGELFAVLSQSDYKTRPCIDDSQPVKFPRAKCDPEVDALLDIPVMTGIAQASPFPWLSQHLALLKPTHARGWWHRRSLIQKRTRKLVQKTVNPGEKDTSDNALEHLLRRENVAAKREGRSPDYFSPVIRDEVLGYLLGGHDTTATTLSWWVKYMSSYQVIQTRLRNELRAAYPSAIEEGRWPSQQEVTNSSVPYLDAVIEETLRCATIITLIARQATCDTFILGYHIPKGTQLYLHLGGESVTRPPSNVPEHLRSPSCQEKKLKTPNWEEDVSKYEPNRWIKTRLQEDGTSREVFDPSAGPTLAFSTGPRQCFGKKQAYLQLRIVITLLIWNFELGELPKELNSDEIVEKMMNSPKDSYVRLRRCG